MRYLPNFRIGTAHIVGSADRLVFVAQRNRLGAGVDGGGWNL